MQKTKRDCKNDKFKIIKLECHLCGNKNEDELYKISISRFEMSYECKNQEICKNLIEKVKRYKEMQLIYCFYCGNNRKNELDELDKEWWWTKIRYECKKEKKKWCKKIWKRNLDPEERRDLRWSQIKCISYYSIVIFVLISWIIFWVTVSLGWWISIKSNFK